MRRYILPILATVLAIVCYILGAHSARERLEILELKASAEAGNLREIRERAEIDHLRSQIEAYQKIANATAPKVSDSSVSQASDTSDAIDITPFLIRDPEYARIHRENLLNMLKRQYGDLKQLNLAPDQLQKLTDLLVDRYSTLNDARDAAVQAGLKFGSPDYTKAVTDATKDDDDQIKSLLGSSGYQQLQGAAAFNTARTQMQISFGLPFNAAGIPLTNDQLLALASIQVKFQGAPADTKNEDFATLASQVLTPDQNALYSQSNASQKESNDLVQRALAAAKQQYGDIKSWHVNGP